MTDYEAGHAHGVTFVTVLVLSYLDGVIDASSGPSTLREATILRDAFEREFANRLPAHPPTPRGGLN